MPSTFEDGPLYLDASALVKLYFQEPESDLLGGALHGRTDVVVSDLGVTEATSALARRRREGVLSTAEAARGHAAIVAHLREVFILVELESSTHRVAERLLLGGDVPLRAGDALHVALALAGEAGTVVTYDPRLAAAAQRAGLLVAAPGQTNAAE